jgi:hypothetical protein
MKIKEGQFCVRYTTPSFWMNWTTRDATGAAYDSSYYCSDKLILRMDAIKSEILRGLANEIKTRR